MTVGNAGFRIKVWNFLSPSIHKSIADAKTNCIYHLAYISVVYQVRKVNKELGDLFQNTSTESNS